MSNQSLFVYIRIATGETLLCECSLLISWDRSASLSLFLSCYAPNDG